MSQQQKAVAVRKTTTPTSDEQADIWELSQKLFQSGMIPKSVKNAKALMYIILMGRDMGWSETQALANITVINDKPSVYADGLTAILHRAGHKLEETITGSVEDEDYKVTCKITREDTGTVIERSFSVAMAKRAGLWETEAIVKRWNRQKREHYETKNDSPWWKYPERMIWRRAISWAVRDACSDEMYGLQVVEEMEDHVVTIQTAEEDADKPSRLAQKLKGNIPEDTVEEPETIPESLEDEDVEDAVILEDHPEDSGEETERPSKLLLIDRPDAFKENLEAFCEFFGYGREEYGTVESDEREEPEVVYFKGVTYRTFRGIKQDFDPSKPDAKYDRPALNDTGELCYLSLAMIEKFATSKKEDNSTEDPSGHSAPAAETDEGSPKPSSVELPEEARDWLSYCDDKETTYEMISEAWPIEQDLEWFVALDEAQKADVITTTETTIEALKEAGE